MKSALILVAVLSLGALSASQSVEEVSFHHRRAEDPRCSQLEFQSTHEMPAYNGPGFGAVSYSNPDEPFIVPAGCSQFSCKQHRETYRVLSCPNLTAKHFARTTDTTASTGSKPTGDSVPGSK